MLVLEVLGVLAVGLYLSGRAEKAERARARAERRAALAHLQGPWWDAFIAETEGRR